MLTWAGVIALVAFAGAPLPAQAQDLSGEWMLTLETPRGEREIEVVIEQAEMAFTGTATTQMGEAPLSDGSIEGDRVTFVLSMAMGGRGRGGGGGGGQGRTVEQRFEGTLADGVVTGEVSMSGMGGPRGGGGDRSFPFTMRRVEG
jgi:hypothetical protein